jgi:polysaccharide biosynthesis transport protein
MPDTPLKAVTLKREDLALSKGLAPRPTHAAHDSTLSRSAILFALFKHKGKIALALVIGLLAAAAVYFLYPPVYESQAKLLVRYLVERSSVDAVDSSGNPGGLTRTAENVLGSEEEILTSWDLAVQVADAIGAKRLLPHEPGTPTKEAAAKTITTGLEVGVQKGSNIIFVSYKNSNPEMTTLVLSELVNRYFNKHLEVHRSAGAFDFVTQQTDQVRARLNQTEDALKDLKEKAGIVSLTDSYAALSAEIARTEEQLDSAEAELAEQQARVRQLGGSVADKSGSEGPPKAQTPEEFVQQYQVVVSRLPQLRQAKMDLLAKYTPQNELVKANQAEIDGLERQRKDLEKKYPDLVGRVSPIGSNKDQQQLDPASETARLAGLQAKKEALTTQLKSVQERIHQLSQLGPQIADLERQKKMQEANYTYFEGTLEKARVDEALDPSKIPNISIVQQPSPPIVVTRMRDKLAMGLAGGGLAVGIAFALVKELLLNQTIKRPIEIESSLGVRPLMSIPWSSRRQRVAASNGQATQGKDTSSGVAPWDTTHFIRPFCEAIRDRLNLYFELNQLAHKPKLVGITAFSKDAGTSTLTAGLAAALSETGDGKVLLVDANLGPEHVHPFFRGLPAYPIQAALQPASKIHSAGDNLYLATVASPSTSLAQLGLKKFFELMPNLKASDFDYIIFDMPPLSQTSPTIGMAGFMDKLLLVVDAEQTNREIVRRGYSALVNIRNNVSVVLNKTHHYAPKWADDDI